MGPQPSWLGWSGIFQRKVAGLIRSQDACLGCRFGPLGHVTEGNHIAIFHTSFSKIK